MSFYYENQGSISFLVYKLEDGDAIDTMSLGMITNNHIQGFAPAIYTQTDSVKSIKYNVSSRVSVRQFFSGLINRKSILGVFSGIADALLAAEDYMIDPKSILLDLDYMFADVSTYDTVLVCLPVDRAENVETDPGMFLKSIMFSGKFDQSENCDYVTKLINFLNGSPSFSAGEFKKKLLELGVSASEPPQRAAVTRKPPARASGPAKKETPEEAGPANQPAISAPKPAISAPKPALPYKPAAGQPKTPAGIQMAVPGARPERAPVSSGHGTGQGEEKEISLFYLLQHYNKENAAKYKAQKEAKKRQEEPSGTAQKPKKEKREKKGPGGAVDFPVPGQAETFAGETASASDQSGQCAPVRETSNVTAPAVPNSAPAAGSGFGETTVLDRGMAGETTLLSIKKVARTPYLVRRRNNERVPIDKPVFRIGKERSYVDYYIGDNSAVSRSHANIVTRDGEYFIVDTNSTNHTFVNGGMISSNTETRLSQGALVRLADEEFIFNCY